MKAPANCQWFSVSLCVQMKIQGALDMHTGICLSCLSCLQEKDAAASSDDYGKDLATVQALQRKHEGFEVSIRTQIFSI